MYEFFEDWKPEQATMEIVEFVQFVVEEFREEGFVPTLRQIYYQCIDAKIFPNTNASYDRLGRIVTRARKAALLPWDAVEDRLRNLESWLIQPDKMKAVHELPDTFALDFWEPQGRYVEVWVEKDSLAKVVERPCGRWRTPYMACRGYMSASEAYRAGTRFAKHVNAGRECHIIHLGDHDPSGIDMTRDIIERVGEFTGQHIPVRRIALNMDQVEEHNLSPDPAKVTDSRAKSYIPTYGDRSWELDALKPRVIDDLIDINLRGMIDRSLWNASAAEEREVKDQLQKIGDNWEAVERLLDEL